MAWTARDAGQDVADEATERARQTAGAAVDQVHDVAASAAGHAQELAGTVKQQASRVTDEVSTQALGLAEEAKTQLEAQAQEAALRLARGFYQLAGEAQALAEGRPADAPNLGEYVERAADRFYSSADGLNSLAASIDQRGIEGLVTDLQGFARRRPAAFMLGATVAGFAVGRVIRSRSASGPEAETNGASRPGGREWR
ncbi:MAG TPA: hypothetical protein VHT75_07935 [Acidimicrobiales bacterium]|nr:hypothetical protein [Acidimicrobiales bacterium]